MTACHQSLVESIAACLAIETDENCTETTVCHLICSTRNTVELHSCVQQLTTCYATETKTVSVATAIGVLQARTKNSNSAFFGAERLPCQTLGCVKPCCRTNWCQDNCILIPEKHQHKKYAVMECCGLKTKNKHCVKSETTHKAL